MNDKYVVYKCVWSDTPYQVILPEDKAHGLVADLWNKTGVEYAIIMEMGISLRQLTGKDPFSPF